MASALSHPQMMMNSNLDQCTIEDEFFDIKPFLSYFSSTPSSCNSTNSFSSIETHHQNQTSKIMDIGLVKHELNNTNNWSFSQAAAPAQVLNHDQKASSALIFSSPQLISFGKSTNSSLLSDSEDIVCKGTIRDPLQAQYHVVAERKRREKLTGLFISLSKILPGLKKLDKASLLEDCIKHMKELQERVRTLQKEVDIANLSSYDNCDFSFTKGDINEITRRNETNNIPEIKVRIAHKDLLIKILCQKNNIGLAAKIPTEMEKLHLIIQDIRVMPFGCTSLDITILAEMDSKFSMPVNDIIKHLRAAILTPNGSSFPQLSPS